MKTTRFAKVSLGVSLLAAAFSIGLLATPGTVQAAAVRANRGTLALPTYPWGAAVPHPHFRGTDDRNIYPYPMFDNLSREKSERTYRTVVLENEYLRITFLPELGGKIHEVIDKTTGKPMFYVNSVVKPGLIGMCGAWVSGGVEWNTGPQGHTVSAVQPVDVVILPEAKDGSRTVAIGETERIYGTKWTVLVTLRPGRAFIEERIRIYNPTDTVRPYYFWNCTAVPNTPGFRFIYPMTLGCDHGAEKFFDWPIDNGKDLTRGTNYYDASSIFAWHCDQDFFGSYDDGVDRGIVAFANHHQVPGKKAWTWGQGGYGKMHQMDLTDDDGPYNEVQTGPLLTQGEVGRLEPSEAVEWQEWWYPVHGIGGFDFASRDVAVNPSVEGGALKLKMISTAVFRKAAVQVRDARGVLRAFADCALSPTEPKDLTLELPAGVENPEVEITAGGATLARFRVPLDLPKRTRPERKAKPETVSELAQVAWDHYLFARFKDAESQFAAALKLDPKSTSARLGLAVTLLDRDPAAARNHAEAALATEPNSGLAQLVLARAALPDNETVALDCAWKASLDPSVAAAGRAFAAGILIGRRQFESAIAALSDGPWETDLVCQNRRALAFFLRDDKAAAVRFARASLEVDPLDAFALGVLWLAKASPEASRFEEIVSGNPIATVQIAEAFSELKQDELALRIVEDLYLDRVPAHARDPMPRYWAEFLRGRVLGAARSGLKDGAPVHANSVALPYDGASIAVLKDACRRDPSDGHAALYLGHVLFHLGRHQEGRALWKRAAELGGAPVIAYRALGMASLTLENDPVAGADHLSKAHAADPNDAIVARDLARVLLAQADKTDGADAKKALCARARDTLRAAFAAGKSRSDFVCLLGRAHNRLGEYGEIARMLDSVRITVWEGSREAHNLFEEAHLALGREHLAASRPAEALKEFDRALEYPDNLAIGRLENAREAHIHRLRAEALAAMGQEAAAREAREKAERSR